MIGITFRNYDILCTFSSEKKDLSSIFSLFRIQNQNSGCWSSIGRVGGNQPVNLQSPACTTKVGTILHEFMHAAGFMHEQNREERDQYIDVVYPNIMRGYESNFVKASKGSTSGFGVPYDYGSVMHYSASAFSSNGQPTIRTKVCVII